MNETAVSVYRMNPAEDEILYGDELRDGAWVLADDPTLRSPHGKDEDAKIRAQRFHRVNRLRREAGYGDAPAKVVFIGEWVDGYQEIHRYAASHGWIVKKDPAPDSDQNG